MPEDGLELIYLALEDADWIIDLSANLTPEQLAAAIRPRLRTLHTG